jgi:hypothetical protein
LIDGDVDAAVRKLTESLDIPKEPLYEQQAVNAIAKKPTQIVSAISKTKETSTVLKYSRNDVSKILVTAAEIAHEYPEQAFFLYENLTVISPRIIPKYIIDFVHREFERLKPSRIEQMFARAFLFMKSGGWQIAEQLGHDILSLDPENEEALSVVDVCQVNAKCELLYQQAITALKNGFINAASTFLRDVYDLCPGYGDPAKLLSDIPIKWFSTKYISCINRIDDIQMFPLSLLFSPDGRILVCQDLHEIAVWDFSSNSKRFSISPSPGSSFYSPIISPDGKFIVALNGKHEPMVWDLATGDYIRSFDLENTTAKDYVWNKVALSPDSKYLAVAIQEKCIELKEYPTGNHIKTIFCDPVCIDFSPDGNYLACVEMNRLFILQIPSLEVVALKENFKGGTSIAYSPDGKIFAVVAKDGEIVLYSSPSCILYKQLQHGVGAGFGYRFIAFSPDGELFISSNLGGEGIAFWDWKSKKRPFLLREKTLEDYEEAEAITFSPNGKLFASGHDDTIRIWKVIS